MSEKRTPNLYVAYSSDDGSHGGEPPGDDPMLKRVEALEKKVDKIDEKLDAIGKDLSYLKGKVDGLPTTLQLLGFVIAVLAIAGFSKYLSP